MANFKALPIAAAVVASLAAMSASAVEFHGYFRAGFGMNTDGGAQKCYGTGGPNAHVVGRLGDECDMYAELSLSETVYEKNGEAFSVHTLMAWGTIENFNDNTDTKGNSFQGVDGSATGEDGPWTGQRASFREAYGKYKMKSGTELWAGNRYYGRKDVHIWDFYYVNGSGYGAGVDNIKAGPGALAFAVRQPKWHDVSGGADKYNIYASTPILDVRYNALSLGSLGSLDLIAMAGKADLSDKQEDTAGIQYNDKTGVQLTAEHSIGLLGGFNKVVAQYSTEGFAWAGYGMNNHLGDSFNVGRNPNSPDGAGDTQEGRKAWRLIDHGVVKFGKQVSLGYAALYSDLSDDCCSTGDGVRYSVTVRPQYAWNDTMSTILEAGYYSQNDPWMNETNDLSKVTLAQAWSPLANGGFWARPQIRVFVSQYGGGDEKDGGPNDWQRLKVADHDTMVGAQVEAWW